MSQLAEILSIQKTLEESFNKKMTELGAQIQSAGTAKDTVAKVAEEFRTFRELMYSMLGLLRKQIHECAVQLDGMETRHRRKALLFQGLPEADKEDCSAVILDVLTGKLAFRSMTASSIKVAHRLGNPSNDHARPILVKFASLDVKAEIWRAKSGLKGTKISVKEFLTKDRQSIFARARQHFGMRSCWTQDGVIVIKAMDGSRHKVTTSSELNSLLLKFPKPSGASVDARGVSAKV
ncbi:uncharacterized protein LOC124638555 [Helicoverpa zea]|uniref:uncharacterized protein LOC124638555 n=1 Tax=Helicoverpa zea TaxID=7113 RepID=UPI001F58BB3D|nr:uncharacterized protein LOC124638555 [Helicoverpa zea]